jgi:hypothetical protein
MKVISTSSPEAWSWGSGKFVEDIVMDSELKFLIGFVVMKTAVQALK